MAKSLNEAELNQASGGAIYIAGKDDAEIGAKKDDVIATGLINGEEVKVNFGSKDNLKSFQKAQDFCTHTGLDSTMSADASTALQTALKGLEATS